ncbi:hypothetical protein B0J12DRAFT_768594 [Macrophomina phaseolina]|uniref:Uncharacterized protein n=1 Tax=Macrophomina phaseolina TaxID=35725 RepID=A0ABQ8FVK8_9PEZI|nr:hypothetical protein B0J12DRAFT_768594 [Macrophomina phaseolina]
MPSHSLSPRESKISLPRKSFPAPLMRLKFIPQRSSAARQHHRPASLAQAGPNKHSPIKMGPSQSSSFPLPRPPSRPSGLRKLRLFNASTVNLQAPLPPPPAATRSSSAPVSRPLHRSGPAISPQTLPPTPQPSVQPSDSPITRTRCRRDLTMLEPMTSFPAPPRATLVLASILAADVYIPRNRPSSNRNDDDHHHHQHHHHHRNTTGPVGGASGGPPTGSRVTSTNFSRPLPHPAAPNRTKRTGSLPHHLHGPVGVALSRSLECGWSMLQEGDLRPFEPVDGEGEAEGEGEEGKEEVWPLGWRDKELPGVPLEE